MILRVPPPNNNGCEDILTLCPPQRSNKPLYKHLLSQNTPEVTALRIFPLPIHIFSDSPHKWSLWLHLRSIIHLLELAWWARAVFRLQHFFPLHPTLDVFARQILSKMLWIYGFSGSRIFEFAYLIQPNPEPFRRRSRLRHFGYLVIGFWFR